MTHEEMEQVACIIKDAVGENALSDQAIRKIKYEMFKDNQYGSYNEHGERTTRNGTPESVVLRNLDYNQLGKLSTMDKILLIQLYGNIPEKYLTV